MSSWKKTMMAAAGGGPPVFNYEDSSVVGGGGATSHTFSAAGIGDADANRYVIVGVGVYMNTSTSPTAISVTVGGQSTTAAATQQNQRTILGIYVTDAPVTSGTTADIVVSTSSNNFSEKSFGSYSAINIDSTTPTDTLTATGNGSGSIDVLNEGAVIGFGSSRGYFGYGGYAVSWSNLTNDFDLNGYNFGVGYRLSGSSTVAASDTTVSPSWTFNDPFHPAIVIASFR